MTALQKQPVRHREEQRTTMVWVWVLLLGFAAASWWVFGGQLLFDRPLGPNPPPDWLAAILLAIFGLGFPWLLLGLRLRIELDDDELRWSMRPFAFGQALLVDIERVEACTYRPLRDYLGWGVRYMPGRGWAYALGGNRGVRLWLRSGKVVLLGSNRPEELAAQIEQARGALGVSGSSP